MASLHAEELIWAAKLAAWLFLVTFTVRFGLCKRYRLLCAYTYATITLDILMNAAALWIGTRSLAYFSLFIIAQLIVASLAVAFVLRVNAVLGPIRLCRDWHLVGVPLLITIVVMNGPEHMLIHARLLNISYCVLSYLGLATSLRMVIVRDIELGWNLKMALLAVSLPATLNALVLLSYSIGLPISYEKAQFWTSAVWLCSWVILAVGMSEYSPPRGPGLAKRVGEADGDQQLHKHHSENHTLEKPVYVAPR